MINLAVLNIKDLLKYLVKITVVLIIVVIFARFFYALKNNSEKQSNNTELLKYCVNEAMPILKQFSKKGQQPELQTNFNESYKIALNSELGITKTITSRTSDTARNETNTSETQESLEETEVIINNSENVQPEKNATADSIPTTLTTEIIDSGYNKYNCEFYGIKIKNESSHELNEGELNPDTIAINTSEVLIFHTHTCESYTTSDNYQYIPTGNYRTTDLNFTVARVGDELEKYLKNFGINVFHDKTYHDYPAYSGSYGRSLTTVQKLLGVYNNTDILIDLHRDAIGDNTYAPKVKIGEEIGAQLMFVIGTDGSGLAHDNWRENLKFAIKIQKKANEMYPGLFKPILVRNSRYNQQLAKGACIIEVGATGNTMEECLISMKYLSKVIDEAL